MARAISIVFVVFVLVAVAKADLDWKVSDDYYCGPYLSCNGASNVMCNKRTEFSSECNDPKYVLINEKLKSKFLDTHNELRNAQALGSNINEEHLNHEVTDMATVSWDDELELMSLVNAMQCKMAKDECRRTITYNHVGQNVYELCSSSNYSPVELVVDWAIKAWFDAHHELPSMDEFRNVSAAGIENSEHFLQVVKSNANRIGCSVVKYLDAKKYRCTVVGCNYNAGNVVGYSTYDIGMKTSECTTGTNPNYQGLCGANEDYNKHPDADVYFTNQSPIVTDWVKHEKQIVTDGATITYKNL